MTGQLLVPNKKTIKAMKQARTGKLRSFHSVEALMADLAADNSTNDRIQED